MSPGRIRKQAWKHRPKGRRYLDGRCKQLEAKFP
jgi:hypothetical protein